MSKAHSIQIIFLIVAALIASSFAAEISYENLKSFWESTYDPDRNGSATVADFVAYFRMVEPEHDVEEEHAQPIFDFFDSDNDHQVTLQELISVAKIKVTYKPGHKQIHLGLTANEGEMQVMWVSTPEHYNEPIVEYGLIPGMMKQVAEGTYHTYNVGKVGGFHGRIYVAVMKDLHPLKKYFYRVGDRVTRTFSKIKYFTAPPLKVQALDEINIAVFGDMGTFAPFGHFVIDKIAKDHFIKPFHFVFLTGDIAYAGMNSQTRGESEPIWDLFGELS
jgi:acid phosphatase type 7